MRGNEEGSMGNLGEGEIERKRKVIQKGEGNISTSRVDR